ncbi:MAG: Glucose-responsive transcription factor [Thelocarpon superellum]|nr:MAG: Glucose-responsive transcription factor [Thelocarpon superellum]
MQLPAPLSRREMPSMASISNGGAPDLSRGPHVYAAGTQPDLDLHDEVLQGNANTPRKRSKVSRACDECRRKKIRCDATSESGLEHCTSCKRVGTRCQFSRVPMKRGPSKGYIKELADRLNTLENSMIPSHSVDGHHALTDGDDQSPRASDEYSPPSSAGRGGLKPVRKRTFSATAEHHPHAFPPHFPHRASTGGWPTHESPRHLPYPASTLPNPSTPHVAPAAGTTLPPAYRSQTSPNGVHAQPLWKHGVPEAARKSSTNVRYDVSDRPAGHDAGDTILEWDEQVTGQYYHIIHPTYPLLPNSKDSLRSRLANCPVTLREAFLEALSAAVRSFPSARVTSAPPTRGTRKAADLIATSQFENPATRTISTNLIYLQTMVLMAIEADNRGPARMRGHVGPPKAVWLGGAVGLAYHLRLHQSLAPENVSQGDDEDSDERIGRRDWWVLVMMDRWHASSTSTPLLVPCALLSIAPEDQHLLGDAAFHLSRLSLVLGQLSSIVTTPKPEFSPTSASMPVISSLLSGQLDRFHEHIRPPLASQPLVELAYWHVRLLIIWHTSSKCPQSLLTAVIQVANLLNAPSTPPSPLTHYSAALAALTFTELYHTPETRDEAWSLAQTLSETLNHSRQVPAGGDAAPSGWIDVINDAIRRKQQQHQSPSKTSTASTVAPPATDPPQQGSLQHLADLAVRGEHGDSSQNATDSSPTTASTSHGPPPASHQLAPPVTLADPTQHPTPLDALALSQHGFMAALIGDEGPLS